MPLFSKKSSPQSLSNMSKRWDALQYQRASDDGPRGPHALLTAIIIFLCLAMGAGFIVLWKAGEFEPQKAEAAKPNNQALASTLESARMLMKQSQWSRAETVLYEATLKFPEDQETRIALAETFIAEQKFPDAYNQYEKALAIGPREARMEFAAGMAASSAGLTDRAEEHFSMAQSADPNNPAYALMLGTVQRKLGHVDSAKANLLRVVHLDPNRAIAWGTLADIALSENNLGLALQHIDHARRLQPDNRDWRLIEARAHKRQGEPEKALRVLLAMDSSQKREGPVVRQIAECYSMLGRHNDAAAAMANAFASDPTDKDLAYDTALYFERAGDKVKAIDYAKQAKVLGHAEAAKLITRLSS